MKIPAFNFLEEEVAKLDLEKMGFYLLTYPAFINFFKKINTLSKEDVLVGYGFTYSWMPTIPKNIDKSLLGSSASILNQAKVNGDLSANQLEELKKTFNNSIVGVSKLLHFINPENFPIWDSNVARAVGVANHKVNSTAVYCEYKATCLGFSKKENFNTLLKKINKKLESDVSALRALEILLFSIGKDKKNKA
ncbi:MAG TPA: hypothetical protein ENJ95_02225 [Bacteroidetes bacterium]|nr:hypothetical protein [Bacteroidota bacterium]